MPTIITKTYIKAPRERVFDLSRSIDFHTASTQQTDETVISERKFGLLEQGEKVTWRAKHLGVYQKLTSKIPQYNFPFYFVDEMQKGIFKRFSHKHTFKEINANETLLIDEFEYKSPLGFIGKLADIIFLKSYMVNFLIIRNKQLKLFAESNKWKQFLSK
ncbi:SRPBCC family protein [Mesonia aquimarina]|uniref:SRPBCC family protein n=1 Tax=Mesonia aquimarina TaxID=1504967 RepID=UPI000EF5FFB6|nr:SRPBCC family protein [Mesonia aquimarina]